MKYVGWFVLIVLNILVLWKKGWLPDAHRFEWPPVGLCLGMEGALVLGFPDFFGRFFNLSIEPIGWMLILGGFFLQLLGTQYARLG